MPSYDPYSDYIVSTDDALHPQSELVAGERIGPPIARSRGRRLLQASLAAVVVLAAGWSILDDPAGWQQWVTHHSTALQAALERKPSKRTEPEPPSVQVPPLPPPLEAAAALAPSPVSQPASAEPAVSPLTTGSVAPVPPADAEPAAPLPPPKLDPADPYQKRAIAVGLHPELSRVLLARLSATDYRNAGIAITKAIAETPDTGILIWPSDRSGDLAQFQVGFVPGISPACRRYVVKVSKDGWLTTAPPMERCGAKLAKAPAR